MPTSAKYDAARIGVKIVFEARASTILFNLAAETFRTGARFLLPANVCPVVPLALLAAGRPFEFVDLDPESLCMDWTRLRERITARNKPSVAAVLYARTYGIEGDAGALFRELKALDDKLLLIDDRCGGRPEPDSALADPQGANVVLYSTGYGKYVDLGFGGFAHMHDEVAYCSRPRPFEHSHLRETTSLYKQHIDLASLIYPGAWPAPEVSWANYREAIVTQRAEADRHKAKLNAIYRDTVPGEAQLPTRFHQWRFQVRVSEKKALLQRIFEAGLFASDHYFPASRLFGDDDAPVVDGLHAEIVNLFNDSYADQSHAERVARLVGEHVAANTREGAYHRFR